MSRKRFQGIFAVVMVLAFLPTVFPVFSVANRVEPFVLGLPFAFFWVVGWIFIVFALLVVMYLIDPDNR